MGPAQMQFEFQRLDYHMLEFLRAVVSCCHLILTSSYFYNFIKNGNGSEFEEHLEKAQSGWLCSLLSNNQYSDVFKPSWCLGIEFLMLIVGLGAIGAPPCPLMLLVGLGAILGLVGVPPCQYTGVNGDGPYYNGMGKYFSQQQLRLS